MRISDGSSDVCSSDLLGEALFVLTGRGDIAPTTQSATPDEDVTASLALNRELCQRSRYVAGDRKSVGSGQSVAVRVSLCGCRMLQKKILNMNQNTSGYQTSQL